MELTETDILELEEAFKHLDRDNNGLVNFVEVVKSLRHYGLQSQIGWLNQKKKIFLFF